ncbi:uncharacterized protein LOC110640235 [Hevea brasiliensis]|uniref:uncharacterized protein LOC110640235 n=2 Tax=Hevea brasiliensis TaxID=3981 RepID=UPI0025E48019|nr:uncharacterized protein LOC110640235 [Hevea brasiliensis]
MSIDAKDIQILAGRIVKLSVNICCGFVQNHPFVSSVVFFLFVLYLFLPKVVLFLLYSSPFLACTAVFIRVYLHSQHSKTQNDVKDENKDHAFTSTKSEPQTADLVFGRNDKSSVQSQALSHRNVKEKYKELESQALMEEKNKVSSTIPKDDSIGRAVLNEVKPREITEKDHGKGVSRSVFIGENIGALGKASKPNLTSLDGLEEKAAKCDGGGKAELENSSSEEDDEEEGTKGGRGKAVEWTENDQKNVMDLGITELERNKRLESLIARRRERKSFKMQTEKILLNVNSGSPIPVVPVLVARGNPFDVPNNPDEQVPGSAPSVLLPTRNPFDLPYDPFEEKPNLMADSFQREFMAAHQREMLFCRHESFTLGPFFPLEGKHNEYDIAGNTRLRRQQGKATFFFFFHKENHDRPVDNLLSQNGGTLHRTVSVTDLVTEEEEGESSNPVRNQSDKDGELDHYRMGIEGKRIENTHGMHSSLGTESKTKMRTNAINHNKDKSSSSSLPEDKRQITKPNKLEVLPPVFRFPEVVNSPPNSAPCPIPKARTVNEFSSEVSPFTIDRSRLENHLLYTNNGPWHTHTDSIASDMQVEVSEIGSPPLTGDESASSSNGDSLTYDGDIEKEITSGSEEMWGPSPHAHEMAIREVNEVIGEDIAGGFSGFHREPQDPTTSASRIEMPQEGQIHSINSDHMIFNDVEQVVEEVGEHRPPNALHAVPPEKSTEGTYKPHEGYLHRSQASLSPPKKSAEELNISYNLDVPMHAFDDSGAPKSVEDSEGEAEKSITSEVRDIPKPDEEINSESSKQSERNSLNTPEQSAKELNFVCTMDDPVVHMNSGAVEKSIEQDVKHLSKPDEGSNLESSNHIESKSSNSIGMPAKKVNIPYYVDDPVVQINVSMIDMKSSEDRDRIEKYIEQEVLVDLAKRDEESTSEMDKYTESNSDMPPANQPIIESIMPTAEDKNSNEAKDSSIPSQDGKEEKITTEVQVSGVDRSSNDPSTSGKQPEMTVEQISNVSSSSSSPKSVLPERILLDQSPSNLNQQMHIAVSESDMEERIVRNKLLDEQVLENLALTAPQNVHHVTHHPSIDSKYEKSEESEKPPREFTQDANGNSGSKDLTEHRTAANPPEPTVDHVDMPVTTAGGEALLQNSTSINYAIANGMVSMEKHELVNGGEGEPRRLDENKDTTELSKASEDPISVSVKDAKPESRNMTEDAGNFVQLQPASIESNS